MYPITVEVVLLGKNGMMGLSRRLWLPFVPYPGLELEGLTAESLHPEVVATVGYDVATESFRVELEDRKSQEESLSELIDAYGREWQLHEPGWNIQES